MVAPFVIPAIIAAVSTAASAYSNHKSKKKQEKAAKNGQAPGGVIQAPTKTPQQMQSQNQLLQGLQGPNQQGLNYINDLLSNDQEAYNRFSSPYLQQYQQQILPEIAEKYAAQNGLKSSAFRNAISGSATDLSSRLAAMRENMKGDALSRLLGFNQQAQGQSFENIYDSGASGHGGGGVWDTIGNIGNIATQGAFQYGFNELQGQQNNRLEQERYKDLQKILSDFRTPDANPNAQSYVS